MDHQKSMRTIEGRLIRIQEREDKKRRTPPKLRTRRISRLEVQAVQARIGTERDVFKWLHRETGIHMNKDRGP